MRGFTWQLPHDNGSDGDTTTHELLLEAADGTGCGIVATQPGQMVTWLLQQAYGDLASIARVCSS